MDLREMLCLLCRMRLPRCPTLATQLARGHHLTQPWQRDSQKTRNSTRRLMCCACHAKWWWRSPKCCPSAAPATEAATHLLKTTQKYCACHTQWLSACYETCWNVTKCHACHAKRVCTTLETSKSNHFCRTRHRQGHFAPTTVARKRLRTIANGCERLRTQKQRRANTSQPPAQTPEVKRAPFATRIREKKKPGSKTINFAVERNSPRSSTNTRSKKMSPQGPENTHARLPQFSSPQVPKKNTARSNKHVQVQKKCQGTKVQETSSPYHHTLQNSYLTWQTLLYGQSMTNPFYWETLVSRYLVIIPRLPPKKMLGLMPWFPDKTTWIHPAASYVYQGDINSIHHRG